MHEIRTVTTLRSKQADIERAIAADEAKIAQARPDLAHINAAIGIFEAADSPEAVRAYADLHQIWKEAPGADDALQGLP